MGKLSFFVNAWACLWTLFVSIIFILPTVRPVTATTMNYASAFLALILGAAAIFWYIGGRRYYTGPIVEAQAEDERSGIESPTSEQRKEKDDVV